jgi:hypothetical protein
VWGRGGGMDGEGERGLVVRRGAEAGPDAEGRVVAELAVTPGASAVGWSKVMLILCTWVDVLSQ